MVFMNTKGHDFFFKTVSLIIGLAISSAAQANPIQGKSGFFCKVSTNEAHDRNGLLPNEIGFVLKTEKTPALGLDPYSFRKTKGGVVARQKREPKGMYRLTWKFDVGTTEAFTVPGTIRVWFDPKSMAGRIRTNVPASLTDGGSRTGSLKCEAPRFKFPPKTS